MEEKKENQEVKKVETEITEKQNTVKMNPGQPEVSAKDIMDEFDSMTKNKLKEVAGQLYYQNQQLMNRVKSMDMTNMFRRLDYLFKVMEQSEKYPKEFVNVVVNEICMGMYPEGLKEQ